MKKIEIIGSHQKYKINKANDPNNLNIIEEKINNNYPEYVFEQTFQIKLLNNLYLNFENKINFEFQKNLLKEINKKLSSYITQDKVKNKYNNENISIDFLLEKLVSSKLKCYYCKCNLKLFYKKVKQDDQWTLDRIDNNLSHTYDNVVISCLKCNLQRRCRDKDKFLYTKQLKIIKKD